MHAPTKLSCVEHNSSPPRRQGGLYRIGYGKAAVGLTVRYDKERDAQTQFPDLIVAIARNQDRAAFARLFEHFAPRIKTLMMQLGAPPVRAEEVAQDTMLSVWRKAHLFDPAGASASGWIYRIAKNLHIDALRRDRRLAAIPGDEEDASVPQPDATLSARETEGRVRAAIAQLGPEQLRVITLSFFEDKPHAEIAKELSIPLGTVKSRVRLAMQRLRDLLDNEP
jgi:RNA polymerase sigma-70 factor, ECF subfamily